MVGVEISCVGGAAADFAVGGDEVAAGVDVMFLGYRAANGVAFVEFANVDRGATAVGFNNAVEAGVVG